MQLEHRRQLAEQRDVAPVDMFDDFICGCLVVRAGTAVPVSQHHHPAVAIGNQLAFERLARSVPRTRQLGDPLGQQIVPERVPAQLVCEFKGLDQTLVFQPRERAR